MNKEKLKMAKLCGEKIHSLSIFKRIFVLTCSLYVPFGFT